MRKLPIIIFCACFVMSGIVHGQTDIYTQFWNKFSFTEAVFKKSAVSLDLGQRWTSTTSHNSMFAENSRLYVRGWMHYHLNARWKFSGFLAYYANKSIPEINQKKAPEIRSALEALYFFKKIPYTLNTRVRIENRNIQNDDGDYKSSLRLRCQLRCIYPLNSKIVHHGTIYAYGADEIMVKTSSQATGEQFFDRNRFTIGGGYGITDNVQIEITYVNDFLPRPGTSKLYNVLQANMSVNNPIKNFKNVFTKKKVPDTDHD